MEIILTAVVVAALMWAFYTGHLQGFKSKVLADIKAATSTTQPATPNLLTRLEEALASKQAKVATPASIQAAIDLRKPAPAPIPAVQTAESALFAAFARGQAKVRGVTK